MSEIEQTRAQRLRDKVRELRLDESEGAFHCSVDSLKVRRDDKPDEPPRRDSSDKKAR